MELVLWTHQMEQTTSVQQSIHVTQDTFSMEISQEHVKRMQLQFGVRVIQLSMVSGLPILSNRYTVHSISNDGHIRIS